MYLSIRCAVFLLALPVIALASGSAAADTYAPIMPLAARSLLLDVSVAGDRVVVAGERGHILYSDDNGISWQQARVATTQMLTGIHFVDEQRGWAVGHDGLVLISNDGGENWRIQRDGIAAQQQTNLEMRERAHQQISELELRLTSANKETRPDLEIALEDAVMDLEDADLALAEPVFTSPLLDVWFMDDKRGWAVGAFGALLTTIDAGQHWSSQPEQVNNPDEFHLNTITGDGKHRVFIAGEGGVMYRSVDGGQSWESLEPFYEGSWFGAVYNPQHDALLVFGLRGNLYRSTDFGDSWAPVASDNTMTLAGGNTSANGEIVLAGSVGTVLRSKDGGQSFQRIMLQDRLSLASGLSRDGQLILIGQGGVKTRQDAY
jgi:photosystem II stability/assembly factor-like uncharacterized protein